MIRASFEEHLRFVVAIIVIVVVIIVVVIIIRFSFVILTSS